MLASSLRDRLILYKLYRCVKKLPLSSSDMIWFKPFSRCPNTVFSQIKDVRDHRKEDRMESFFLAETTKYLYLLFDTDNFIHNHGQRGMMVNTPWGECILEAGGYIFNTVKYFIFLNFSFALCHFCLCIIFVDSWSFDNSVKWHTNCTSWIQFLTAMFRIAVRTARLTTHLSAAEVKNAWAFLCLCSCHGA